MSYVREPQPVSTQAQPQPNVNVNETTGAGPIATSGAKPAYSFSPRRVKLSSRIQKIGYWVIVAAALALLIALLGVFLPKFMGALFTAFFAGLFVSVLTLMNLPKPSGWGNSLLGRKVFPVIQAASGDIMRLSWVNGVLVFIFTFVFQLLAYFVGPVLGGILVFAGLAAAGIFYNRARSVIIRP